MVMNHSDSERGNPLPLHGLLLPISSNGYFICIYIFKNTFLKNKMAVSKEGRKYFI